MGSRENICLDTQRQKAEHGLRKDQKELSKHGLFGHLTSDD